MKGLSRNLKSTFCDFCLQFPVPAPVLVVDANKDIADMRQLFETISAEIVDQSEKDKEDVAEDKENTPEKSLGMGTKRSCDQKENVERSKKQTVLSNVNWLTMHLIFKFHCIWKYMILQVFI